MRFRSAGSRLEIKRANSSASNGKGLTSATDLLRVAYLLTSHDRQRVQNIDFTQVTLVRQRRFPRG
jgi:hypothetical protein